MNLKFEHNHYVPILKGKAGEFGALANLSNKMKQKFTPLIDIPPISFSNENDVKRLNNIAHKAITSWGVKYPFFIDMLAIKPTKQKPSKNHPLTHIFQYIKNKLFLFSPIPTTGIIRDGDYNEAVKEIISRNNSDVCIRLFDDDMINVDELDDDLKSLLRKLQISPQKAHLLLDFRAISEEKVLDNTNIVVKIINNLRSITEWRTLTVAASSFPETVAGIEKNSIEKLPRVELSLWMNIMSNSKKLLRVPSYGDYGIVHPDHKDYNHKVIKSNAKIRYTLEKEWLIIKGQLLEEPNWFDQYYDLSQKLVARPEFKGSSFSKGDDYIAKCAERDVSCGKLETWITTDTTHHLTLVSDQFANFVVS